jgi:geranylgeranyl diphosphate synthase type II
MIHALATADSDDLKRLNDLMHADSQDKVAQVLEIYRKCGIDNWANELKLKYLNLALSHLESIVISNIRKEPLVELAYYLIQREK